MSENGLNKVQLIGRIGVAPDLKHLSNGGAVLKLRIACNESWFDKTTNEKKTKTEWMTVLIWGKRGESLSKFMNKGDRVYLEGKMQTRGWEDKDGNKRQTTEINAHEVILLGEARGGSGGGGGWAKEGQDRVRQGGGEPAAAPADDFDEDEIPF